MSEQDPTIKLSFGDTNFEGTRHNMTLFTFWGELASRDHVFIQTEDIDLETRVVKGTYIFRASGVFEQIAAFMWENDYPMVLNSNEVPSCDEVAYQTHIDQQAAAEEIGDFIPDDWGL